MQFLVLKNIGKFLFSGKGLLTIVIIALGTVSVYQYYSIKGLEKKLEVSVSNNATANAAHQICESDATMLRSKIDAVKEEMEKKAEEYKSRLDQAKIESKEIISKIEKKEFESAEEINKWYREIISDY